MRYIPGRGETKWHFNTENYFDATTAYLQSINTLEPADWDDIIEGAEPYLKNKTRRHALAVPSSQYDSDSGPEDFRARIADSSDSEDGAEDGTVIVYLHRSRHLTCGYGAPDKGRTTSASKGEHEDDATVFADATDSSYAMAIDDDDNSDVEFDVDSGHHNDDMGNSEVEDAEDHEPEVDELDDNDGTSCVSLGYFCLLGVLLGR